MVGATGRALGYGAVAGAAMTGINDNTVTITETAKFFGVAKTTVWSWIDLHKIEPAGQRWLPGVGRYANTYRFLDMANAERKARKETRGRPRGQRLNPERFDHH